MIFFFQAEDGIRDLVRSRGLGDVYKRQVLAGLAPPPEILCQPAGTDPDAAIVVLQGQQEILSLIHI